MEWILFLIFPTLTVAGIALGLASYSIQRMKIMDVRILELENKVIDSR